MNIVTEIEIDIVGDILIFPEALAPRLGKEVQNYIIDKISNLNNDSLIHLNLINSDPIDYLFTKTAFGNFFSKIESNPKIDVIFYCTKSLAFQSHLLRGILEFYKGRFNAAGDIFSYFGMEHDIKLHIKNEGIKFVSNLTTSEKEVLKFINDKDQIDINTLDDILRKNIKPQELMDAVEKLKRKKFIYSNDQVKPEKLFSTNSFIKTYEKKY